MVLTPGTWRFHVTATFGGTAGLLDGHPYVADRRHRRTSHRDRSGLASVGSRSRDRAPGRASVGSRHDIRLARLIVAGMLVAAGLSTGVFTSAAGASPPVTTITMQGNAYTPVAPRAPPTTTTARWSTPT